MNKRKLFLTFFSFFLIICISVGGFLFYKHYYMHKDVDESNIAIEKNSAISIYLDDGNGNYTQASTAPTSGYKINNELTHCIGGGEISFNSNTGTLTYNITGQDKCYVYFEKLLNITVTQSGTYTASVTTIIDGKSSTNLSNEFNKGDTVSFSFAANTTYGYYVTSFTCSQGTVTTTNSSVAGLATATLTGTTSDTTCTATYTKVMLNNTLTLSSSSLSYIANQAQNINVNTNTSGGTISCNLNDSTYFTITSCTSSSVTVTSKTRDGSSHSATLTVTSASTDLYNSASKTVTLSLPAKANQTLTLSPTSLSSFTASSTQNVTVSGAQTSITASSNNSKFTTSVSGSKVSITSGTRDSSSYTGTITITAASSADYNAATKTISASLPAKTTPSLSTNTSSISFTANTSKQVTVSGAPSGSTITATSSDTTHFTTSVSGTTVTVTSKNRSSDSAYSGTITIKSSSTADYNEGSVSVSVSLSKSSCFTGDSLVMLSDYSYKRIDELTYEDKLLVWDFFNGEFTAAKPLLIFHHADDVGYLKLTFDDGTILKIVNNHKLFDYDLLKWVEINLDNYENFMNHTFVGISDDNINVKKVKLIDAEFIAETVSSYSAETILHTNLIVEGMLTFTPQVYDGIYEQFDIDDSLKYDEEAMINDINKYGLYTPDVFEPYGLSEEQFYILGGQYFKLYVGRGIMTFDNIIDMLKSFVFDDTLNDYIVKD